VVSPGLRSAIVTLFERKSQDLRVRKCNSHKSVDTMRTAYRSLQDLPQGLLRTLTLDNRKEFAEHHRLNYRLGLGVYCARLSRLQGTSGVIT